MVSLLKTSILSASVLALTVAAPAFADTRIQGAGATFPAPLYAKWVEAYNKLHPDVKIDYQAVGSGGGIKAITDRTVQFGASDAPLSDDQEKAASNKLVHLPTVAGPEVMIYNLPGVANLKLNGEIIAGIYLKKIRTWNDPKIVALNAGVNLPASPILVVHRSDGSGTSFIFTDYLSKVSPEWNDKVGRGTSVEWPVGIGGKGNDGVASNVKNTAGGIGYVEYAFAKKNSIPFATQLNDADKEVAPTIEAINAAASASLKSFPENMKVSIVNAPGDTSYPICGFTYILLYQDMSSAPDKATAEQTIQFIKWCETDGQDMAADLGYARLPKEAQEKVLAKLGTFTYKGEALGK